MNSIAFVVALLLYGSSFSQTVVVDSETLEPLPFAVMTSEFDKKFYANAAGEFEAAPGIKYQAEFFNYNPSAFKEYSGRDTIKLLKQPILLNEISVPAVTTPIVKKFSKPSKLISSVPLKSGMELCTKFKSHEFTGNTISEITYFALKDLGAEAMSKGFTTAVMRINVYSVGDACIGEKLHCSAPLIFELNSKKKLSANTLAKSLELSPEGLWIGLELIGVYDKACILFEKEGSVRIAITQDTETGFEMQTFLRNQEDRTLHPINDFMKQLPKNFSGLVNLNTAIDVKFIK